MSQEGSHSGGASFREVTLFSAMTPTYPHLSVWDSSVDSIRALPDREPTITAIYLTSDLQSVCLSERSTILPGSHSQASSEGPTQNLRAPKAAGIGNFLQARRCRIKLSSGSFEPEIFDVPRRRLADLLREHAGEVARAHCRAPPKGRNRHVLREIVRHPGEQISERLAFAGLRRESCTEL